MPRKRAASVTESESDGESKRRRISTIEDDAALAARIQAEIDAEDAAADQARLEAVRKDQAYVDQVVKEQEAVERTARAKRMRAKNIPDRIIFQFKMDASGKTIEGTHDEDNMFHLQLVKRYFETAMTQNSLRIKTVEVFLNHLLEMNFETKKQELIRLGRDATEITMFHGTQDNNLQPIIENGFKVGGAGTKIKNGAAFGLGVYLAKEPGLSQFYCTSGTRMIAVTTMRGSVSPKPIAAKYKAGDQYDSIAGSLGSEILVVRDAAQCLPRYIVTFESSGPPGAALAGMNGFVPFVRSAQNQPMHAGAAPPGLPLNLAGNAGNSDEEDEGQQAPMPIVSAPQASTSTATGFTAFSGQGNKLGA